MARAYVDDILRRTLTQLEAQLPGLLDEVEDETVAADGSGDTYAQTYGELTDPVAYLRLTPDVPEEIDHPTVLVEIEGLPDFERWATPHRTVSVPLSVRVVGRWGDETAYSEAIAWLYAEAVDRCLRRHLKGDGVVEDIVVESQDLEIWDPDAFGRVALVRATATKWAASAA